jgi:hypothetical protein
VFSLAIYTVTGSFSHKTATRNSPNRVTQRFTAVRRFLPVKAEKGYEERAEQSHTESNADERKLSMTSKERVVELIEHLPEELAREVQIYAEYLCAKSHYEEWSRMSLAHLAARYTADEVAYTLDDVKP